MKISHLKETLLVGWGRWAGRKPGLVLLIVLALTVLGGVGISLLEMNMTFYSILPSKSQQVKDLKRIMEDYPFGSNIVVVVDGRDIADPEEAETRVKQTIDLLEQKIGEGNFGDDIAGIDARFSRDFIARHGMLISKEKDIQRMTDLYPSLDITEVIRSLNDDFEKEYSGNEENLEDDESLVAQQFKGLEEVLVLLEKSLKGSDLSSDEIQAAVDNYLLGDEYFLSNNRKMGILFIRPTFNMNDIQKLGNTIPEIDNAVLKVLEEQGLKGGLTGMVVVGKDEMKTSEQGFAVSMLAAFFLVIALMIVVFRMKMVPLYTGLPLLLGIIWTMGAAGFALGHLNIMTAMYMVALIGLGIDYAIHLITTYVQERDGGADFYTALEESFRKSGPGIVTGALTTAIVFLMLGFSDAEMISELGIVAGLGILCELAAMLMVIPALLALRYRWNTRRGKPDFIVHHKQRAKKKRVVRSDFLGRLGTFITTRPGLLVILLLLVGAGFSFLAPGVSMEDNLMKMEAKGLKSIELQDTLVDEFGMAPDSLMLITKSLEEAKELTEKLEELESVKSVDSPGDYLLTDDEYFRRSVLVNNFNRNLSVMDSSSVSSSNELLEELYRLEANMMEMGETAYLSGLRQLTSVLDRLTGLNEQGEKIEDSVFDRLFSLLEEQDLLLEDFQSDFGPVLKDSLLRISSDERPDAAMLPPMIRDSFISPDGDEYLLNISPGQNPWEGEFRKVYTSQIRSVTDKGTGMILASDQMTQLAGTDGLRATIAALLAVFILLLLDFKNLRMTLLTFIPLGLSFSTLMGIMALSGIKFDFVNIIAIPLLIGIGIDDAVHINHRYILEGKGSMKIVIAKTGTAVFLTTLTTMIGFASFIPSIMRAMRSTGIVLTLAMALAFIYSIILHPSILMICREKWNWNLGPRWGNNTHKKGEHV